MSDASVPRTDASAWTFVRVETRGANEKVWLRDEETESDWLFKPRSQHSDGSAQIGDWVEWASSEVAALVGVPSATVRLGQRGGQLGCLSLNVAPSNTWEVHSGRLWLDDLPNVSYSSVVASLSKRVKGASPGHTMENVRVALDGLETPPGMAPQLTGWDVFVGYLLLDALTSNRDRHEENWSVMLPLRGIAALAPTYDMENGLGFQLSDNKRTELLECPAALDKFLARGTAYRFDGDQGTSLVDLVVSALDSCSEAGQVWLGSVLARAETIDFAELLRPADGVSEVAVSFAQVVLGKNVRRMRDAYDDREHA